MFLYSAIPLSISGGTEHHVVCISNKFPFNKNIQTKQKVKGTYMRYERIPFQTTDKLNVNNHVKMFVAC